MRVGKPGLAPVLVGAACAASALGQVEYRLVADADSRVFEGLPDTNFGAAGIVRLSSHYSGWWNDGVDGRSRGLFHFDLSEIPAGAQVLSARLELFQSDSIIYPGGFEVFEASGPWTEDGVTWSSAPGEGLYLGHLVNAYGVIPLEGRTLDGAARGWLNGSRPNNGVLVRFQDEYFNGSNKGKRGDTIVSKEAGQYLPPTLVVTVACAVDVTGDGAVDTRDMLLFVGAWAQGDPLADWNADGLIDTRDFIDFLGDWARGC